MYRTRIISAAAAFALMVTVLFIQVTEVTGFTINSNDYIDLAEYPDIKTFDYAVTPVRENIPESSMVDPEYTFRVTDRTIDEYFGTIGTFERKGKTYKGCYLNKNQKGKCGVRYNKLFRYQDDWIDVKTTYVDWSMSDSSKAFVSGGFCQIFWKNVNYLRMHHEFYISGTNTPVDIKGFFTYTDVDDFQGLGLLPSEVKSLWTYTDGSQLKYKTTEEGYLFIKDPTGTLAYLPDSPDYDPVEAAQFTFSYSFEGSSHDQFILDGKSDNSFNVIGFELSKVIPSRIPSQDTDLIRKQIATGEGEYEEENHIRSWDEQWQYRISALLPMETEEGNLLDGFSISDRIDSCLDIVDVRIQRGAGTDVTELFDIQSDDGNVVATAKNIHDEDMYGYMYYMVLNVRLKASEAVIREHGHFTDKSTAIIKNKAVASYTDGNDTYDRETNETRTEIQFPYRSDISITKKIKTSELYFDHGVPSFIIRLRGTTEEGEEEVEYNKVITFDREFVQSHTSGGYVMGTVTFKDVPEGTYRCDEYDTRRYELSQIADVSGGSAKSSYVVFNVNSNSDRAATFVNSRTDWNDYSDSQCIINKFGRNQ